MPTKLRTKHPRGPARAESVSAQPPAPVPSSSPAPAVPEVLSQEDFRNLSGALGATLESFGEMLVQIARIERIAGVPFPELSKRMATPQFLGMLVTVLPPEDLGLFVRVMVRLASLGNLDMNRMTHDQKSVAGTTMKEVATDLRSLVQRLDQPQPSAVRAT